MLEKKDLIQKSFRIDRKLDEALSELSKILNRSQNELIDYAIRLLIDQNNRWFAEGFVDEFYNEMVDELYKAKSEIIEDFELRFIPYDNQKREGAFLALYEYKNGIAPVEVLRVDVGNEPGTHSKIKNALGEVALIIVKKYPELKRKYGIPDIDV